MIAEEVKLIRDSLLLEIKGQLKNNSYFRAKIFKPYSDSNSYTMYDSWIFVTDKIVLIIAEFYIPAAGAYIISDNVFGEKPLICLNTYLKNSIFFPLFKIGILKFLKKNQQLLDHEITHYLDNSKGMSMNNPVDYFTNKVVYYNCIGEVNAYMCSEFLNQNCFEAFIKQFEIMEQFYLLNYKNKQRVLKRAYQYYYGETN